MFKVPRIIAIRRHREKTLLDFVDPGYAKKTAYYVDPEVAKEAQSLFNDKDVLVLVLWAVISPAMGLAYLIITKYKSLRWLTIPLIALSVLQFWFQWRGLYEITASFFGG
ncbi:hypothetical protein AUJ16_01510 [Candidatus Micrarchaeota archaeon CG1_02_60_51]|nr:MAG: hypothetical protein AUJ16_01510 [Candidatus Micrarchaeota archaeon CG1_02_60_51]PIO02017.1 MAG: hypothetical protein COT58_02205 [Candidatus Micrarchaeota archaeon CG09_land_8_20_14_0_10_60_16]